MRSCSVILASMSSSIRQATTKSSSVNALRSMSTPATVKANTNRVVISRVPTGPLSDQRRSPRPDRQQRIILLPALAVERLSPRELPSRKHRRVSPPHRQNRIKILPGFPILNHHCGRLQPSWPVNAKASRTRRGTAQPVLPPPRASVVRQRRHVLIHGAQIKRAAGTYGGLPHVPCVSSGREVRRWSVPSGRA